LSSHAESRCAILQKRATSGNREIKRESEQTSAHQRPSSSACAAFVGSDFRLALVVLSAKPSELGAVAQPRHVTRPRSNRRTSLNQTSPPLTSINTSPQNGCASITHCLLDVHRLAICTTEELSLQPAWTSPTSSSELRQRPATQLRRTKRGLGTLRRPQL
jgi:hypothetical protein